MKKILGITAEYDPFHNGHLYHLKTAREAVSSDVSICVMSGDFTQRGEPAVADKWKRAEIALRQGLNMVLELPFVFACAPAPAFAAGAVDILTLAGASHIAFGCEADDSDELVRLADLQIAEAEELKEKTREHMSEGASHVKARQLASEELFGRDLTALSLLPNNILALEYLKRIRLWEKRGRKIEAVPIRRRGSGYKEAAETGLDDDSVSIAGGSALRKMLEEGRDIQPYLPYNPEEYIPAGDDSLWADLNEVRKKMLEQLKGIAIRSTSEETAKIRFVGEGLEHKLLREIREANNYSDLLRRMTSRRYTASAIRRIIIHVLLGLTGEEAEPEIVSEAPSSVTAGSAHPSVTAGSAHPSVTDGGAHALYGRILALDEKGRRLIAAEPELPFIANVNRGRLQDREADKRLNIDFRAVDLYNLLTGRDLYEYSDRRRRPLVL